MVSKGDEKSNESLWVKRVIKGIVIKGEDKKLLFKREYI